MPLNPAPVCHPRASATRIAVRPPIGIMVYGNGAIFAAPDDQKDMKKCVKN